MSRAYSEWSTISIVTRRTAFLVATPTIMANGIIKDLGMTCFSRSGEWTAEGRFVAANGLVAC